MRQASQTDAKVKSQMRLSNPLLLASLGVLLAAASCTLITDVDRSKIPDGTGMAGAPGGGDGSTQPQAGQPGKPTGGSSTMAGAPSSSGSGGVPEQGGMGGAPIGGAPLGGAPVDMAGMGGVPPVAGAHVI
jgi:hypothetical protein